MQQPGAQVDLKKFMDFGGKYVIKFGIITFALPMLFFGLAAYGIYYYNVGLADEMATWPDTQATITRADVVEEVREEPVLHDAAKERELKSIRRRLKNTSTLSSAKERELRSLEKKISRERRYHDVTYFVPSIAYNYTVDGTERIGRNYALKGYSSKNKQEVENIVKDLQPGTVTRAFYNPKDHSEVALLRKEPPSSVLRYVAMLFVLGSLIAIVVAIKI